MLGDAVLKEPGIRSVTATLRSLNFGKIHHVYLSSGCPIYPLHLARFCVTIGFDRLGRSRPICRFQPLLQDACPAGRGVRGSASRPSLHRSNAYAAAGAGYPVLPEGRPLLQGIQYVIVDEYQDFSVIDQCKQTNPTDKVALQSSNNG